MAIITYIVGVIALIVGVFTVVLDPKSGMITLFLSWCLFGLGYLMEKAKRASDLLEWMAKKNI